MNESIKLKVPEKPSAEKVSVGNNQAELIPNGTVETMNRKFADHLIANYGLEEIVPKKKKTDAAAEKKDFGFPEDFPGRENFEKAEIPFETVQGLTEQQLVKVEGIGPETAAKILNYSPKPVEPSEPEQTQNNDPAQTSGAENSNGGQE